LRTTTTILSTKRLKPALIRIAESAGIAVLQHDFIKTVSIVDENATHALSTVGEWLVFTSKQAVKIYSAFRKSASLNNPHKIYCLQGETMKAVSKLVNCEIAGVANDAASLSTLIVQEGRANSLSFICGKMRRNDLSTALRAAGVTIKEIPVYDTVYNGKPIGDSYKGLLFFSPSAVESYFQTNILPVALPSFCIGNTTAASFREHSNNPVIVAVEPSQEAMVEAFIKYFSNLENNKPNDRTPGIDRRGKGNRDRLAK